MSEIHETTTYVPPTNDDWWIARLLAVKAAWAADQERLRVAEARLVEVEQALRTLQDAVTEYQRTRPSLWGGNEPEDHEAFAAAMTALGIARLRARSVLDKGEPDG